MIYTSTYWSPKVKAAVLAGKAVAVGITLYPSRREYDYPVVARLTSLAPDHRLFRIEDKDEFRTGFRARLHRQWLKAKGELDGIAANFPGMDIILMCWEPLNKPEDWCHRQFVAEFITEKTGEEVTEL